MKRMAYRITAILLLLVAEWQLMFGIWGVRVTETDVVLAYRRVCIGVFALLLAVVIRLCASARLRAEMNDWIHMHVIHGKLRLPAILLLILAALYGVDFVRRHQRRVLADALTTSAPAPPGYAQVSNSQSIANAGWGDSILPDLGRQRGDIRISCWITVDISKKLPDEFKLGETFSSRLLSEIYGVVDGIFKHYESYYEELLRVDFQFKGFKGYQHLYMYNPLPQQEAGWDWRRMTVYRRQNVVGLLRGHMTREGDKHYYNVRLHTYIFGNCHYSPPSQKVE